MRILITGATGFIGRCLLKALQSTPHEVYILYRGKNKISINVKSINTEDINWKDSIKNANPDVVIHLAAYLTSADDEPAIEKLIQSNILFGAHLLDALKNTNIKYFINTGTFAEYFDNKETINPSYLYAATKSAFRHILNYYQSITGYKVVNIIPYTVYGGVDTKKKMIDYIFESIGKETPLNMSPGEQLLDLIYVDDVIDFYIQLLNNLSFVKDKYTEIHLGTGIGTSPKEVAGLMETVTGKKANINWGGIPYRKRDTMASIANRKLPSELFPWKPRITLEEGIKAYLFHLKNK
jgi:nucleoside-diphosphate-sugar epimerase